MPVDLPCPGCGNVASVAEESLGRRARCRKCGEVFALARPGGRPASGVSGGASAREGGSAAGPADLPEQFGRYRIMRRLGQGGMGAVYLAHDVKLDRRVALKVPSFHPADGPRAIQRFGREARAAATLDHPNLCPIFDVGEVDGIHYLTMPYIEGRPLSEVIPRGRALPEAQAAALARKLALALAEAHARGVVHRDLKPGNIMVNRRRELILMDFGLARMAGGEDDALTRTGNVLGTALYMAPEQAAGDLAAVGPASDVYSLGVILYELLTGVRPFEGPWSLVIGLKSVQDPDPPSKLRPDLSPALDAICLKAIARDPRGRHATMAGFAEALDAFLTAGPGPAPVAVATSTATPSGTSRPAREAESLAKQVFAGLVTGEVTSLRGEKAPDQPRLAQAGGDPPRASRRASYLAAAGAAAAPLLGVVLYVATDRGRIKIEVADPAAAVFVDGRQVRIEGPGGPITLRAGEHDLSVRRGDVEVQARKFVVHRGDNPALVVDLVAAGPPGGPVVLASVPPAPPDRVASYPVEVLWGSAWGIIGDDVVVRRTGSHSAVQLTRTVGLGDFTFEAEVRRVEGNGAVELHYGGESYRTFGFDRADDRPRVFLRSWRNGSMTDSPAPRWTVAGDFDRWDHLEIEKKGGVVAYRVNHEEVFRETEDPIASGSLWLATVHANARFRNIKATGAGGKVLLKGLPDLPKMEE